MNPSIADVLEAIRSQMASSLSLDVSLGVPESSSPGLYLYPFHFQETPSARNSPIRSATTSQTREMAIRCLLVGNPPDNLEVLGLGLDYLYEHAVLELKNETIRITISNMQPEELAKIFLASEMVYRLVVAFDVRFTCK